MSTDNKEFKNDALTDELKEETVDKNVEETIEDKKEVKEKNSGNKSNKILIGIIIALAVVIIGLVVIIFAGGKKDNKDGSTDTTIEDSVDSEDGTEGDSTSSDSSDDGKDDSTTEAETATPDCYVKVTSGNSWENGGKFCGQLDASITNNSGAEIKNWTIQIPVKDGTTVDSFWNSNCVIKDGVLTITPVEYNGSVAAGGNLKDIGFIVSVPAQGDLSAMANSAKLLVDGKEYVASSTDNSANGNQDDKEDATTEEKDNSVEAQTPAEPETGTPFDNHGKLSVKGTDLVDAKGNKYQLKGVSTHGIAWFPDYVNKDAIQTFRDDWGANLFRIAMYTDEYGGYCNGGDKAYLKGLVDKGVNAATELGMYVIIDWHILHDLTPQKYKEDAKVFFEEMSSKYKDYDNVIYEICNEPNGGTQWSEVKSYAEEIIPIIRSNDPDAIIIVFTPNWSQDVDIAAQDPITGYDNIMYAIHFYASTHTDNIRNKAKTAMNSGLPIFISEFSICDASGNGAIDYNQADLWFDLIDEYNLSYAAWNVSNKDETSSLIKSSCTKLSGWTESELSDTGIYIRKKIKGIN
ncbi:MAG: cellulase family glycosylhydrolase [Lachnospiraceae bacterium]|nr:cellulase family glycosylhydrolase [Lachnospiraceae bacterium]